MSVETFQTVQGFSNYSEELYLQSLDNVHTIHTIYKYTKHRQKMRNLEREEH